MNYLQFDFETESIDQAEQLIALLSDQNFEGFEEDANTLHAFIPESAFDEKGFEKIINIFPSIIYTSSIVENINWNKKWEEGFQPVIVEDTVAIRAGFHEPVKKVKHEIIITPKMSFGTGHHPTTYLMIQLMLSLDITNEYIIDFGTGTGVLAILAEKLGASKILAIDYDEWSIENAKENIFQNDCIKIEVKEDSIFPGNETPGLILANITLNVIKENLKLMAGSLSIGAKMIVSGVLKNDENILINAIKETGLKLITIRQKEDWIAAISEKCC